MPDIYQRGPLFRGLTNLSTQAAFATVIPTITEPVTTDSATPTSNSIVFTPGRTYTDIIFGGTGNDDTTIDWKVWGFRQLNKVPSDTTSLTVLWVPTYLGKIVTTLSTAVGIAASTALNTFRFADTLVVSENETTRLTVWSPTGNVIGHAKLLNSGYEKILLDPDLTGASAANAFYAFHD